MSVDVGELPAPAGGFSKKQLLIGAAILGAGAGVVILLMRMQSGGGSPSSEADATSDVPRTSAGEIAYQNLAEQILGLRGDQSVWNADLLDMFAAESEQRALSDNEFTGLIRRMAERMEQFGARNEQINERSEQIQLQRYLEWVETYSLLAGLTPEQRQRMIDAGHMHLPPIPPGGSNGEGVPEGAGGYGVREAIQAQSMMDGGTGDGSQVIRKLSAGPLRRRVA